MKEYTPGKLVRSLAGHDTGSYYLILGEEKENVYLVDGGLRPLDHPKKKRKKHLQIINRVYEIKDLTDPEIRKITKENKRNES